MRLSLLLLGLALAGCSTTRPVVPPAPVAPPPPAVRPLDLAFYRTPVVLQCGHLSGGTLAAPLTDGTIAAFLSGLDAAGMAACMESLERTRAALDLNDWGYFLLVRDTSFRLFPEDGNEATLFAWHAMAHAGYRARLSYNRDRSFLLLASQQHIVDLRQIWNEGQRYYIALPLDVPASFSMDATYHGYPVTATRPIDFHLNAAPRITTTLVPVERTFRYGGQKYKIATRYNEGLVQFLEQYPRGNLAFYLGASLSRELEEDLVNGLGPLIADKSEVEALNILLAFVQHGFRYKEDLLHFGEERYLLPDEIFFYPFSDCEDRSILFAFLVRRFLNLDVIGLRYPNHVALAVHTTTDIPGRYVTHEDRRYVVADPSYFGAPMGSVVPQVGEATPDVIVLEPR